MADHKVIDGKVYVGETGTVAWAGDPGEVAQMLDRICELEAERDHASATATAWRKEYRQIGRLFDALKAKHDGLEAERAAWKESWYFVRDQRDSWQRRALYARRAYHEQKRHRRQLAKLLHKQKMHTDAWQKSHHINMVRFNELQRAADQAISDLRVVLTLAIGCEEENTITNIIDEVAAQFAAIMESDTKEETST